LSETKKPTDRKGRQWAIGNEWSDKQGNSEPFSGVLQSQTRDLFKSQPSGERKSVVPRLENSPGKGRFVLDWREWTICAENADEGGTARKLEVVQ